ncbi:hypothetical protein H9P43_000594 [Blastocladiella emersonii ATCC 22665]|nr:hypothetical protein H9P43_000594 [Blastocladiella emersonii ATCC 22665]
MSSSPSSSTAAAAASMSITTTASTSTSSSSTAAAAHVQGPAAPAPPPPPSVGPIDLANLGTTFHHYHHQQQQQQPIPVLQLVLGLGLDHQEAVGAGAGGGGYLDAANMTVPGLIEAMLTNRIPEDENARRILGLVLDTTGLRLLQRDAVQTVIAAAHADPAVKAQVLRVVIEALARVHMFGRRNQPSNRHLVALHPLLDAHPDITAFFTLFAACTRLPEFSARLPAFVDAVQSAAPFLLEPMLLPWQSSSGPFRQHDRKRKHGGGGHHADPRHLPKLISLIQLLGAMSTETVNPEAVKALQDLPPHLAEHRLDLADATTHLLFTSAISAPILRAVGDETSPLQQRAAHMTAMLVPYDWRPENLQGPRRLSLVGVLAAQHGGPEVLVDCLERHPDATLRMINDLGNGGKVDRDALETALASSPRHLLRVLALPDDAAWEFLGAPAWGRALVDALESPARESDFIDRYWRVAVDQQSVRRRTAIVTKAFEIAFSRGAATTGTSAIINDKPQRVLRFAGRHQPAPAPAVAPAVAGAAQGQGAPAPASPPPSSSTLAPFSLISKYRPDPAQFAGANPTTSLVRCGLAFVSVPRPLVSSLEILAVLAAMWKDGSPTDAERRAIQMIVESPEAAWLTPVGICGEGDEGDNAVDARFFEIIRSHPDMVPALISGITSKAFALSLDNNVGGGGDGDLQQLHGALPKPALPAGATKYGADLGHLCATCPLKEQQVMLFAFVILLDEAAKAHLQRITATAEAAEAALALAHAHAGSDPTDPELVFIPQRADVVGSLARVVSQRAQQALRESVLAGIDEPRGLHRAWLQTKESAAALVVAGHGHGHATATTATTATTTTTDQQCTCLSAARNLVVMVRALNVTDPEFLRTVVGAPLPPYLDELLKHDGYGLESLY